MMALTFGCAPSASATCDGSMLKVLRIDVDEDTASRRALRSPPRWQKTCTASSGPRRRGRCRAPSAPAPAHRSRTRSRRRSAQCVYAAISCSSFWTSSPRMNFCESTTRVRSSTDLLADRRDAAPADRAAGYSSPCSCHRFFLCRIDDYVVTSGPRPIRRAGIRRAALLAAQRLQHACRCRNGSLIPHAHIQPRCFAGFP